LKEVEEMRETIVRMLDDLDGTEAAETVRFSLDGVQYEIDLSAANATALRAELADYIVAGRRDSGGTGARRRQSSTRPNGHTGPGRTPSQAANRAESRAENRAIREWARGKRMQVADRGRIPPAIISAYHAEVGSATPGNAPQKAAEPQTDVTARSAKASSQRLTAAQRRDYREQVTRWCKLHGFVVPARGRLNPRVVAAFDAQDPTLLPATS
jgi:hypothetical protein